MKWGKTDFNELKKLQESLNKMGEVDNLCKQITNELGLRVLRGVRQKTQVGQYNVISYTTKSGVTRTFNAGKQGGSLRKFWKIDASVKKVGNEYYITVYNPLAYAKYVEYGHRQEVGRFVPHIGKRLKKGWVSGRFWLTTTVKEVDGIAPQIVEKHLNEYLRKVFGK